MSYSRTTLVPLMLAGLAACSTAGRETSAGDPFLGEVVRYNAAVQTIDPDPVYGLDDARPGDNGDKGAAAVERYRTDKVKPVETVQTTQSTSENGSSGSNSPR